ncbi:hypothetical protein ACFE04_020068 [Oxalis oulophora]
MPCKNCRSSDLYYDDLSGDQVCNECGVVQDFNNYQAHIGGITGEKGTQIYVGSTGTGSVLNYKDKKVYEANKVIDDITFRLQFSEAAKLKVKALISNITDGEFGIGDWFGVLIGACCYLVMRREGSVLPLSEIEAVIGRDLNEIGRMVARIVDYLDLKKVEGSGRLPEFDIVLLFERTMNRANVFEKLDDAKRERVKRNGIFLINCSIKWFITTGRRPGPMVAAVLAFVAEINGVRGCRIEDLAKQVHAAVTTCRKRYKEVTEKLVEVAKVLPWGKDVNIKNIVKNAPCIINYMELKSMEKGSEKEKSNMELNVRFDLEEAMSECLRKDVGYGEEENIEEKVAGYFDIDKRNIVPCLASDDVDKLEISHQCLAMIYNKFADEVDSNMHVGDMERFHANKRKKALEVVEYTDWWSGKSELNKKLCLKDVLEKDVGFNGQPPSFLKGCKVRQRRREKIKTAKKRIEKIMHPMGNVGDDSAVTCVNEGNLKKRRRKGVGDINWEDLIIETLLLHRVKEEEIEKGHYRTLLDLYVFTEVC